MSKNDHSRRRNRRKPPTAHEALAAAAAAVLRANYHELAQTAAEQHWNHSNT